MDFTPDEDHDAIVEAVDRVCAAFDDTYWSACDTDHRFPWEFYAEMANGGWVGIAIPERYGGGGRGITEAALVLNRVAASGAAMNGASSLHLTMFGLNPVVKFGNDRLKDTFLPRAAAGDLHVAFGVTEPDAGTDTSRIATRAVDDGSGGFVVSGRKIWTSKALESEVCLLLARTDERIEGGDRFGGLSLFLVDLDPDHVDIRPIAKTGRNAVASCEVAYDELPVEGWRMVGERGRGFQHILHGLNPERVLLAAEACGIGEAALRRAVGYAKERIVFDRPIGANQAIAHPLAERTCSCGPRDADHDAGGVALRPRSVVWRGGQHGQVPRRRGGLVRRRSGAADARRAGVRRRVPRRAVLARGPHHPAGAGEPGDDLQLRRSDRARPATQLLITLIKV